MSFSRRFAFLLAIASTMAALATVHGQTFVHLSRRLPANANAAIVVNATAMYDSPLGKKENWRAKFADSAESSPLMLPPGTERAVLAAELDIASLRPQWEAAVMALSVDPTVQQIAAKHHGLVDDIGSIPTVWLPPDICVVKFAPKLFGLLTEANRQEATRWLAAATDKTEAPLSAYLEQSVSYADTAGTQMILAVDLAGALRADAIRAQVAESKLLDPLDEAATAKLFSGLQGVKFGVIFNDKLNGKLQLDFADDASSLAPVAKPLILAIVGGAGAMLPEFNDWKAEAKGTSLSIEGELTPSGLRRIFSLLSIDASVVHDDDATLAANTPPVPPVKKTPPPTPEELTAKASLRYFKAVDKYVEDSKNLNRADSIQQAALWLENFARRVDNLPKANVDPDLIKFGAYTSQTFRYVVDQAYGIQDKLATMEEPQQPVTYQEGYVPTFQTVNWGGYYMRQYAPYYNATYDNNAYTQKLQKSADEVYKMRQEAQTTLAELQKNTETVRKNLTEKYKLTF
jgi:hypothetical protein